jgi:hypothetical protein
MEATAKLTIRSAQEVGVSRSKWVIRSKTLDLRLEEQSLGNNSKSESGGWRCFASVSLQLVGRIELEANGALPTHTRSDTPPRSDILPSSATLSRRRSSHNIHRKLPRTVKIAQRHVELSTTLDGNTLQFVHQVRQSGAPYFCEVQACLTAAGGTAGGVEAAVVGMVSAHTIANKSDVGSRFAHTGAYCTHVRGPNT